MVAGSPADLLQLRQTVKVVSRGERLAMLLSVAGSAAAASYFKHPAPLFTARYQFVHGPLCGPAHIKPSADGTLVFPHLDALGYTEPPRDIHCIWDLQVHPDRDLLLHFDKVFESYHPRDIEQIIVTSVGTCDSFIWQV